MESNKLTGFGDAALTARIVIRLVVGRYVQTPYFKHTLTSFQNAYLIY